MGIVLKAFDPKLHRVVAIKVMAPQLAVGATGRKRFMREAQAVAAVSHDHIVSIHAVDEAKGLPYFVMQYIAGRSLQQRIDDSGALEVKEILRIGMQTASGLAAAHAQGLVHRDIKPANILLENGVERVKITDFGLARAVDGNRVTQTGVVTGSPQFMAPEQARGEAVDHRADLFSLGTVMYAMCTGYAPFRASSSMAVLKKVCDETPRPIADLNPEIPDWLISIVERLMEKDPEDRFQSASELAQLLGQHLAHLQQPAVVPQPASVARPVEVESKAPRKRSLALPILLIIGPVIVIPLAMIAVALFRQGVDFPAEFGRFALLLILVIGAVSVFLGLIVLAVQLTRRQAPARRRAAPARNVPTAPRRQSHGWVVLLVILVLLLVCPVPVLLVMGALGWFVMWDYSGSPNPGPNVVEEMHRPMGMQDKATPELGTPQPPTGPPGNYLVNGLNWFPEETTFCASYGFLSAPVEMSDSLWGLAKSIPGPAGKPGPIALVANSIGDGSIRLVSVAFVEDPAGRKSRQYVRFNGLWNRDRVLSALTSGPNVRGVDLTQPNSEKVTMIVFDKEFVVGVIGSSDIVLAGYEQPPNDPKANEKLVQEMLECKATRKRGLLNGPLIADLDAIPATAFAIVAGELPKTWHEPFKNAFGVLPRTLTLKFSERIEVGPGTRLTPAPKNKPIVIDFTARMYSETEAEAVTNNYKEWPNQFHAYFNGVLKSAEARPAGAVDAKARAALAEAAAQFRTEPRISVETKRGSMYVTGKITAPPAVWLAVFAWAKFASAAEAVDLPAVPIKLLKRFDPKTDKPFQSDVAAMQVTTDGDCWRVHRIAGSGALAIHLFDLPKQDIRGHTLHLRFRMKTEKVAGYALVELHSGGKRAAGMANVSATTDWKSYELATKDPGSAAEDIAIYAGVNGTGTIWLKDVELVKIALPDQ